MYIEYTRIIYSENFKCTAALWRRSCLDFDRLIEVRAHFVFLATRYNIALAPSPGTQSSICERAG